MKPFILSIAGLEFVSLVAYLMRRRKPVVALVAKLILDTLQTERLSKLVKHNPDGSVTLETESFLIEWQGDRQSLEETILVWPNLQGGGQNNDVVGFYYQRGETVRLCPHATALRSWVLKQIETREGDIRASIRE